MKILFLALSGVRVQNSELMEIGLTLPGFVERSKVIASLPSLGLLTLAAHTPAEHECVYRDLDEFEEADVIRIEREEFDLVAISALTARISEGYRLADQLRAGGISVVLGGLHVTALPFEAAEHADAIVVGEGEGIWPELLEDFEAGHLQKLYSSFSPGRRSFHLSESNVPRYDLLDIERYNRLTLQTARGCPLDCEFCAASRTISRFKKKPIALVKRDLEAILEVWDRPFLELADDNTFIDKRWARQLVALFKDYPLKWFTETDISVADDDELLELLAESNCAQLLVGFESATPEGLVGIDSGDWKRKHFDRYLQQIDKIQSYGISVNGCFILGLDNHDTSVFEDTLEFVKDSSLSEVQLTVLTPFPSTPLQRRLRQAGRLLKDIYWDQCTLFDVTYRPWRMSVNELESGFRELMQATYSPDAVSIRRKTFRECRRERRRALKE